MRLEGFPVLAHIAHGQVYHRSHRSFSAAGQDTVLKQLSSSCRNGCPASCRQWLSGILPEWLSGILSCLTGHLENGSPGGMTLPDFIVIFFITQTSYTRFGYNSSMSRQHETGSAFSVYFVPNKRSPASPKPGTM